MNIEPDQFRPDAGKDTEWLGTAPIPAAPYYDPAYFDLERDAIFKRCWLHVGHVADLPEPGSFIVRELEFAKANILITRGKDGEIRAFHNVCTHRGTILVSEPAGKKLSFSCPYHKWTFGNDGELRSAPDMEHFYVDKSDCALPPVQLGVCAGLIFINLDPEPKQTLTEYLGPLAEKLEELPVARATTFSEYVYEIDANWKLTYDNFQENYHLRFIHPQTGAATVADENPYGYPVKYGFHGLHRTQTIWTNPQPTILPMQGFAFGKGVQSAQGDDILQNPYGREYFALFPNFFLIGTPVQHFSHTVMPISAGRSRGVIRLYWVSEDRNASERFAREYAMASLRDIHTEDRRVIEWGQRGLETGALKHIHFQAEEALCRHLFLCVDKTVREYAASNGVSEGL